MVDLPMFAARVKLSHGTAAGLSGGCEIFEFSGCRKEFRAFVCSLFLS